MLKQPIYTEFNLDAKAGIPQMIAVTHTDDHNADLLGVNAGHVVGAKGAKGDKGDKGDTGRAVGNDGSERR